MNVTLKLYASLGPFLPPGAVQNEIVLDIPEGTTVLELLDRHNVPRVMCHLVLVNGIFEPPGQRATRTLAAGDHIAAWPPIAGG